MNSKERESIIDRLLKIKALAEQGIGGERSAAERLLNSLMKQYGILPEDLDSDVADFHLAYIGEQNNDRVLFIQIAHKVLGKLYDTVKIADIRKAPAKHKKAWAKAGLGPQNSNIGLHCTKAEFIEVMSTFEIFKEDMHRQEDTFLYAYMSKNDLLLDSKENQPKLTENEIKKLMNAAIMAEGIERKDIYKQIEEK